MMTNTPTLEPLPTTQQGMRRSIPAHWGTPVLKVSHLTYKEWLGSLHWWRKKQMQDPGKGDCGCCGVVKGLGRMVDLLVLATNILKD